MQKLGQRGELLASGGLIGGARLGWPLRAREDKLPEWLVFGAMIRTVAIGEEEPGLRPLAFAQ